MRHVVSATLLLVAAIHLMPLLGVFGPARLAELYGVTVSEPNLEILMRHRAVLFGIAGAFLIYAAFQPSVQWLAFLLGFASVASFLLIALSVGGYNAHLLRVVYADLVAMGLLAVGAAVLLLH